MKGAASMDLASALAAAPMHARGAGQGSRSRAEGGSSDADAFGSVLSDAVATGAAPIPQRSLRFGAFRTQRSLRFGAFRTRRSLRSDCHPPNAPSGLAASSPDAPSGLAASVPNAPSGLAASVPNAPSGVAATTPTLPQIWRLSSPSLPQTPHRPQDPVTRQRRRPRVRVWVPRRHRPTRRRETCWRRLPIPPPTPLLPWAGSIPAPRKSGPVDHHSAATAGADVMQPEAGTGPVLTPAGVPRVRVSPSRSHLTSSARSRSLPPRVKWIALPGSAVASSAVPGVQSAPTPVTTAAAAPVLPAARAEAFVLPAAVLTAASAAEPAQTTAGGKAGPVATPSVPPAGMPGTFNMAGTPTARPTGVVLGAGKVPGTTAPVAGDRTPAAAAAPTDNLAAAGAAGAAAVAPPAPGPAAGTQSTRRRGSASDARPATRPPAATGQTALHPRRAPHGQHIMTLKVSPEDLGPLTVRAHIDGAGVRIELFAPGDTGREALRGILPELRKELADARLRRQPRRLGP